MKRFFVPTISDTPILTGENHKHLSVVLRARPGESVVLCPQDGCDHICEIVRIEKTQTILKRLHTVANDKEPRVRLTVYSALMKGDKNEWAAQKLTELGVSEIVPFRSEFTVVKPSDKHRERLCRVCEEAAKQCGRAIVPNVGTPIDFSEIPDRMAQYDLVLFPYEKADGLDIRSYLTDRIDTKGRDGIATAALIVGSEGGFSEREAQTLEAAGVRPVTMGKRILRAETANITAAAILMYALGELL